MKIPEELLRLSNKELQKKLSDNFYKSKYFIYDNAIFEKKQQFAGRMIVRRVHDNNVISLTIDPRMIPLSLNEYKKIIKNNILENLKDFSLDKIIDIYHKKAIDVFGEDYVDADKNSSSLIIHIPKAEIKNSVEQSIELIDCYFKFNFGSHKYLSSLYFARTTAREVELRNGYLFSHCNNKGLGYWSDSLCMGSTIISNKYLLLRSSVKDCVVNFTEFLFLLKEYLSWESLEGKPYKYIDSIINDKSGTETDYGEYTDEDIQDLVKIVYANLNDFDYNYVSDVFNYKILFSNEFSQKIDGVLTLNAAERFMAYRVGNSSVKKSDLVESQYYYNRFNGEESDVFFKGKYVNLTVIQDEQNKFNYPKKINVNILKLVVSEIESQFTEYIINKKLEQC